MDPVLSRQQFFKPGFGDKEKEETEEKSGKRGFVLNCSIGADLGIIPCGNESFLMVIFTFQHFPSDESDPTNNCVSVA